MMVRMLRSYAAGAWYEASDAGVELPDASTREPVARISSTGLDVAGMLEDGRTVGGPALAALTFTQRAAILKQLALYLNERREDRYYPPVGVYRRDPVRFDVRRRRRHRGAVLLLQPRPPRAARRRRFLRRPPEVQSKDGTFVGAAHLHRAPGCRCVHHAFNFPVWGMLEKFAPAFIAGLPVIVKPRAPPRM
jgi:NAD-dependent aldehyde dehydrogenases